MKRASTFTKIVDRIRSKTIVPLLAKRRRKQLNCTDFTIISNNCWGGVCYEYFNLEKKTPTVGCYFFAEDFVKFCKNLKYYLSTDIVLESVNESKHRDELIKKGEQNVIIGRLDDVEIVFLHYNSKEVILQKWYRRVKRINYEKLVLKFSYQNNCSDDLIKEFLSINEYPKICFCGERFIESKDVILFPWHDGRITLDETICFGRFYNVSKLINEKMEELKFPK